MGAMVIDRNETRLCALERLRAFLEGTGEVRSSPSGTTKGATRTSRRVLKRLTYPRLKRADKGLVLRYLGRTTTLTIHGFHADNASEYINHRVARLLEKLRIELTQSRPRHSNDNGD